MITYLVMQIFAFYGVRILKREKPFSRPPWEPGPEPENDVNGRLMDYFQNEAKSANMEVISYVFNDIEKLLMTHFKLKVIITKDCMYTEGVYLVVGELHTILDGMRWEKDVSLNPLTKEQIDNFNEIMKILGVVKYEIKPWIVVNS